MDNDKMMMPSVGSTPKSRESRHQMSLSQLAVPISRLEDVVEPVAGSDDVFNKRANMPLSRSSITITKNVFKSAKTARNLTIAEPIVREHKGKDVLLKEQQQSFIMRNSQYSSSSTIILSSSSGTITISSSSSSSISENNDTSSQIESETANLKPDQVLAADQASSISNHEDRTDNNLNSDKHTSQSKSPNSSSKSKKSSSAESSIEIKEAEEVKKEEIKEELKEEVKEEVKEEKPKAKIGRKIKKEDEPSLGDEEMFEDGINNSQCRRSKRQRVDNNCVPEYEFETITDFEGKRVRVKKLVGQHDKPILFPHLLKQLQRMPEKIKEKMMKKKKTNKGEESLYCYWNQKKFTETDSPIAQIAPIFENDGFIKVDPLTATETSCHQTELILLVQQGTMLISINEFKSVHNVRDIVRIPTGNRYKIKNISNNEKLILYFYYR